MLSSSVMYLLGEAIVKAVPFLLLPFIINLLPKEEYGKLSLYIALIPMLSILFDLSQRSAIKTFVYDYPRQAFSFLTYLILNVSGIYFLFTLITVVFDIQLIKNSNTFAIVASCFLYTIVELFMTYYQITRQVKAYNILYISRNAMPYVLSVGLFYLVSRNHVMFIYPQLLILLLLCLWLGMLLLARKDRISTLKNFSPYAKYSLNIAVPFLPAVLSAYVLSASDKYLVEYFFSYKEVAEYSLAYNVAMIVQLFVLAINKAWQPFIFDRLQDKEFGIIKKYALVYAGIIIVVGLLVYAFSEYLILFLANKEYLRVLPIMPVLIAGTVFFSFYAIISNIVFFYKKLLYLTIPVVLAALLNLSLNYVFLPKFGYQVAAWTTLIGYIVEFFLILLAACFLIKNDVARVAR